MARAQKIIRSEVIQLKSAFHLGEAEIDQIAAFADKRLAIIHRLARAGQITNILREKLGTYKTWV